MARLALQRALEPAWIDELFEREGGSQYQRELLFSTTVELMSVVAVGLRPSVHAAAQACPELPVSVQAPYDKIKRTEPHLVRALVAGSAKRPHPFLLAWSQAADEPSGPYCLRPDQEKHHGSHREAER